MFRPETNYFSPQNGAAVQKGLTRHKQSHDLGITSNSVLNGLPNVLVDVISGQATLSAGTTLTAKGYVPLSTP